MLWLHAGLVCTICRRFRAGQALPALAINRAPARRGPRGRAAVHNIGAPRLAALGQSYGDNREGPDSDELLDVVDAALRSILSGAKLPEAPLTNFGRLRDRQLCSFTGRNTFRYAV
jgi:hypothetical protein